MPFVFTSEELDLHYQTSGKLRQLGYHSNSQIHLKTNLSRRFKLTWSQEEMIVFHHFRKRFVSIYTFPTYLLFRTGSGIIFARISTGDWTPTLTYLYFQDFQTEGRTCTFNRENHRAIFYYRNHKRDLHELSWFDTTNHQFSCNFCS